MNISISSKTIEVPYIDNYVNVFYPPHYIQQTGGYIHGGQLIPLYMLNIDQLHNGLFNKFFLLEN